MNNKVCTHPFVKDGTLMVEVTRVNREKGCFEVLDDQGEWQVTSPETPPDHAFRVPEELTRGVKEGLLR